MQITIKFGGSRPMWLVGKKQKSNYWDIEIFKWYFFNCSISGWRYTYSKTHLFLLHWDQVGVEQATLLVFAGISHKFRSWSRLALGNVTEATEFYMCFSSSNRINWVCSLSKVEYKREDKLFILEHFKCQTYRQVIIDGVKYN